MVLSRFLGGQDRLRQNGHTRLTALSGWLALIREIIRRMKSESGCA
ncbi:hypothetical protein RE6C_01754 [Rhodopirellula europaea 6C]|uniref:Uncharacterized protein n=1 Tax=Rhodopirellula europaea 6C TaxID=1263867 RepID=M2B704_9BACT|nr:hypothetical protein RE6C_01754 [Rhodopirellula europaea 6C]